MNSTNKSTQVTNADNAPTERGQSVARHHAAMYVFAIKDKLDAQELLDQEEVALCYYYIGVIDALDWISGKLGRLGKDENGVRMGQFSDLHETLIAHGYVLGREHFEPS